MALCAVANDDYFNELFETCFRRHTRNLVGVLNPLNPDMILLCGKKEEGDPDLALQADEHGKGPGGVAAGSCGTR